MSGLLLKRTWLGGVALVAVFGFAACSDDGEGEETPTAGKGGKSNGGNAGSTPGGDGGVSTTAGNTNGGKGGNASAGKGGMAAGGTAGTDAGGTDMGPGGEGGVGGSGGAGGEGGALDSDEVLRRLFAGTSPLPDVPADSTNAFADNALAAALGQRFFFDEKFSGALKVASDLGAIGDTQKVSCKTCHLGSAVTLDDGRALSLGTDNHTRNSPALVNSSYYTWTNWGGRFSAQWELPVGVVENGLTMNGNRLALAHRIFKEYKAEYEAAFATTLTPEIGTDAGRFPPSGKPKPAPTVANPTPADGPWETMTAGDKAIINRILANYSKALQAYTRKLVSKEAPFDAFMAGDDGAIGEAAKNGADLFAGKAGCIKCHGGTTFSDQGFHVLGVPGAADDGRFKDVPGLLTSIFNRDGEFSDDKNTGKLAGLTNPPAESLKGAFRTPSLRGVALTAPYMHAGQKATLSDVIDFYAVAGTVATGSGELSPFAITPQEKADLVAFLGTLSGKPVADALLVDTAKP